MSVFLNGKEYIGGYMNGHRVNGYINGKRMFTPKPQGNNGTIIVKCVDLFNGNQTRGTQTVTVPAGDHISLMDLVHQGKLTVINNKEWFDKPDHVKSNFNVYDFSLQPGQILELHPTVSSL